MTSEFFLLHFGIKIREYLMEIRPHTDMDFPKTFFLSINILVAKKFCRIETSTHLSRREKKSWPKCRKLPGANSAYFEHHNTCAAAIRNGQPIREHQKLITLRLTQLKRVKLMSKYYFVCMLKSFSVETFWNKWSYGAIHYAWMLHNLSECINLLLYATVELQNNLSTHIN